MKKHMKIKITSIFLIFSLIFGITGFTAGACAEAVIESYSEKPELNYLALGASNVNGYGLRGYNRMEIYEEPFKKNEDNRYGYKMNTPGSYPVLVKEALSEKYDVNLSQFAMSSLRMEEIRFLLDEDYYGDSYTDSWLFDVNGDGVSANWGYGAGLHEWNERAEAGLPGYDHIPTDDEALAALRDACRNDVANADLITIDVGMNNFGTYMFNLLIGGIYTNDVAEISPELAPYVEMAKAFVLNGIKGIIGENNPSEGIFENFTDALIYALVGYCVNFDAVMSEIYALNPDVEVIVVSIQNMMRGLNLTFPGVEESIPFGDIFELVINAANLYSATLSPYSDSYFYANVSTDGRTEFFLDELAAYDGNPEIISTDLKDCFDVYDGSMFLKTRVQQMFAVRMSKSGFVKLADSQKNTDSIEGVTAFYYGLHYDDENSFGPAITLADGTPLKDFFKQGENEALSGDAKAAYKVYLNMLTLAYDVVTEIMSESARVDTMDLTTIFASSALGISTTDILYGILNDAMEKSAESGDYSFDLGELYPKGFFNGLGEEYDISAEAMGTLFAFSLRLTFAGTAFSHPNANGHREIADTVINAYESKTTGTDVIAEQIGVHYMPTEDSYYLALSDGNAGYAEIFANRVGLNGSQLGYTDWEGLDYEKINRADLISIEIGEEKTLGFASEQLMAFIGDFLSNDARSAITDYVSDVMDKIPFSSAFAGDVSGAVNGMIDEILADELFAGKDLIDLDWSKLLDEETLPAVDYAMAEIRSAIVGIIGAESFTYTFDTVEWLASNAETIVGENPMALRILTNTELLYGLLGDKSYFSLEIPIADAMSVAVEAYLYRFVEYSIKSTELISYINESNPDAKIVIFGHFNPIKSVSLSLGDSSVDMGKMFDLLALASTGNSLLQFTASSNSAFVYISEAESVYEAELKAADAEADLFGFLTALFEDDSVVYASEEGNAYIAKQMLNYVFIDCDHRYDSDCDEICNKCNEVRDVEHIYDGCDDTICNLCRKERAPASHVYSSCDDTLCNNCDYERIALSHVYGSCDDTVCDDCGYERSAATHLTSNCKDTVCTNCGKEILPREHSFGDWVIEKEADESTEGRRTRSCSVCGYAENEKIPSTAASAKNGNPTAVIVTIASAVAVAGGSFAAYWFVLRKKKPTAEPIAEAASQDEPEEPKNDESDAAESSENEVND